MGVITAWAGAPRDKWARGCADLRRRGASLASCPGAAPAARTRPRVKIRVPLKAQTDSPPVRARPAAARRASVLSVLSSSAVVLDSEDRVLQASAAARAFGLVSGDQLVVQELLALARQVRRDGEIREGEMEVSTSGVNRQDDQPRGPRRAAGPGRRRRRPGPAAGRGPDREPPGGRGPAGLRRQHQPRAQDPGRGARAAGRDGRGRGRRPGGGAPLRRPHAAGGVPAHQPGAGHDHAVPDPGGRADPRPGSGRARRRRGRGTGPVPDEGERPRHRAGRRRARTGCPSWATRTCWSPRCATCWRTPSPTARTRPG